MLFNSYIFICLFLPLTLIGYFGLRKLQKHELAKIYLILMSLWFYAYNNPSYLILILSSIVVNYLCSYFMNRTQIIMKKVLLIGGVLFNVGLIFYFKYYDFFVENLNMALGTDYVLKNIILPLGISFFTFQQISFVVDAYRGDTKDYSFVDYALFVTYFPQLVAGPIVLHNETIPQFNDSEKFKINYANIGKGLYIFAVGMFKKVLLADSFGQIVGYGYSAIAYLSALEAVIVMLLYTFQIYYDFSGYCDMARGIGYLFNIELACNFNSPYQAKSITEFWDRWHMTLTRFLRTYIYFPLGGNRKGTIRTYFNIMVVYLVSGIWHGANWTFIVWGIMHGIANCLNRIFQKPWDKIPGVIRWLLTFAFVNIAWVFFRADSVALAVEMIKRLAVEDWTITSYFMEQLSLPGLDFLRSFQSVNEVLTYHPGVLAFVLVAIGLTGVLGFKNCNNLEMKYTWKNALLTAVLFMWTVFSLSGVSTFLYFNF